jgi:nicotinamide-nucleotide amidase
MSEPTSDASGGPALDLLRLIAALNELQATVATAESLTGGLVGAALTDVPGVSSVYRGGAVVYATELKATLAGVPSALLDEVGPVHPDTAAAMAAGVRDRLGATYGIATTGVAGPDPQDGHPAGEVYVAAAGPFGVRVEALQLSGDRPEIRAGAVAAAIQLAADLVESDLLTP